MPVLKNLELCINEILTWMTRNKLKINDDKTEFMIISSKQMQKIFGHVTFHIGSTQVAPSKVARNLSWCDDRLCYEYGSTNHIYL